MLAIQSLLDNPAIRWVPCRIEFCLDAARIAGNASGLSDDDSSLPWRSVATACR